MAKYQYIYETNNDGNQELKILTDKTMVIMILDPNEPDHFALIALLSDVSKLERYVEYLGDDPDRPFVMSEIEAL